MENVKIVPSIDHETWVIPGRRSTIEWSYDGEAFLLPPMIALVAVLPMMLVGLDPATALMFLAGCAIAGCASGAVTLERRGKPTTPDVELVVDGHRLIIDGHTILWSTFDAIISDGALHIRDGATEHSIATSLDWDALCELRDRLRAHAAAADLAPADEAGREALDRLLQRTAA